MEPRIKRNIATLCVSAAVAGFLAVYYSLFYQYHLYAMEENQIFLLSKSWLATYFPHFGWLAGIVGDFLTALFHYKFLGPLILATCITAAAWATYRLLLHKAPLAVCIVLGVAVLLWLFFCSQSEDFVMCGLISLLGYGGTVLCVKRMGWWGLLLLPLAFWLFGFRSVCHPSMPKFDKERMLAVEHEYAQGNYEKAMELALTAKNPNVATSFYYYLSSAKMDQLPENLLKCRPADLGTLNKIGEDTHIAVINMMNDLYYELGDMMYAERAAMMRNVFSPQNRNARMMKRLAEVNLVSGDTAAAKKYLRILSKTLPYRKWAQEHTLGNLSEEARMDIIQRRRFVNTQDTMRLGDNCRTILLELLESNPENDLALDYLLCTSLLLKEMDTFKSDYDRYCMAADRPRVRPLYQQALMIYLAGTNAPKEEWERYILMPEEFQRFQAYNMRRGSKDFADTYWYYFDKTK